MKTKITPKTLVNFKVLGDVQISPNGKKVAYTVTKYDLKEDKQVTNIYTIDIKTKKTNKLTENGKSNTPRWDPNSEKIAYVTTIKEEKTLNIMNDDGSQNQKITGLEQSNAFIHRSGEKLSWSPEGKHLLYTATPDPKPNQENIVITERQIMYNLTGYIDDRRTQIYTVSLKDRKSNQITGGSYDNHSPVWSPNGDIIFISDRTPTSDQHVNYQIFHINPDTREETQLTCSKGAYYKPQVSPNGNWIAVQHVTRPLTSNDSVSEEAHLWVISIDGKKKIHITEALDHPIYAHSWTTNNRILFTCNDKGKRNIYVATIEKEIQNLIPGEYQLPYGATPTEAKSKIAYTKSTSLTPGELYIYEEGNETKLTEHNDWINEYTLSVPEVFWFTSWDNQKGKGIIFKPVNYQEGKKYPTLLNVHGGPHGAFGPGFDERAQLFVNNGYVVIEMDPRGSSGYGQKWSDGCLLNWGGGDYKDLMKGLDYCIHTYPYIDPEKLGVTGGSYGGYMTNWIVTQTDIFKAGVSRACVTNLLSFYGTSAVNSLIEQEFNGNPWENLNLLHQWSPITHANKCKTPLLLLHGTSDMTCPITQSEEMFRALKRHNVPTKLIRYVGEGHGIRKKASNKIHYYQQHLKWFNKYL